MSAIMRTRGVIKTHVLFNLLTQSISTFCLTRESTKSFTAMDKTIIVHSEKCENPSTYKLDLCLKCRNKYKNENRRLNNMKKMDKLFSQVVCQLIKDPCIHKYCVMSVSTNHINSFVRIAKEIIERQ